MVVKNISTSENFIIHTENNSVCTIEITTYLGTTVFKDTITPINKTIKIKGLNPGKYIVNISNNSKLLNNFLNIKKQ